MELTTYKPKPKGAKIVLAKYKEGKTKEEIAVETGYSIRTVCRYVCQYGDKVDLKKAILAEAERGTPKKQIARQHCCSVSSVYYYISRHDTNRTKRITLITNDLLAGKKQADIARAYDVSRQYVSKVNNSIKKRAVLKKNKNKSLP